VTLGVHPAVGLSGDQVALALRTAGLTPAEDTQLIATALSTALRQSAPVFAALAFGLEPSHYRLVLERQQA
jgi:hypothetical protein